ncbi:Tad domain-containing protein [Pseudarthrobacter sp. HLT3-5]|uniref:TadE/TadG family type IV pilus assembly protein n=1 Tax=Pseudarthrobacter cellobiosi TaxID=2953654 RepID=UPI00208EE71E|nr:TadE/TadG family type IV pilus assembly protein [Pseudarthrobacter sp. HLT3-5]MCO4275095.1 Tad domain-containing protein [Pseudarthrobacter sp. HLT3-5]
MWRLTQPKTDNQRGAAGVTVAVTMLVLIGAGAMAVDVGQIYSERAQLQNGADAGAIAVVQACYKTGCSQAEADSIAATLADANANDAGSNVLEVDLSVPNQVTVRTSTRNGATGAGFLTQMFSSALNTTPATVGAYAVATAEPPSSGSAFPLALSECQYDLSEGELEGEVQLVRYKPGMDDCTSTSGHVIPGGFGWLDQSSPCVATTDADAIVSSDTGADYAAECDAILNSWIAEINSGGQALATFPVYDEAGGSGTGGWFHIRGYATFDIQGWKFGGGSNAPRSFHNKAPYVTDPADACTGSCLGIIGQFIRYESIETYGGGGGVGDDMGTVEIRLID